MALSDHLLLCPEYVTTRGFVQSIVLPESLSMLLVYRGWNKQLQMSWWHLSGYGLQYYTNKQTNDWAFGRDLVGSAAV